MSNRMHPQYFDERLLVGAIKESDHEAYAFLFDKYYRDMVLYARTFIPEMDFCEDTVQNMFFNLWQDRRSLAIHSSLKSYILRTVRNSCLDEIRHRKVKHTHAAYEFRMELKGSEDTTKYILYSDLRQHLESALEKLPPQERDIFEMSRFENKRSIEISEELNIPLRTVQLRISKAVEKLQGMLKDFYFLMLLFFLCQ